MAAKYTHTHTHTHTSRSAYGQQYCRGALERGGPSHTCKTYTTLHYADGGRYHFCDDHPPETLEPKS